MNTNMVDYPDIIDKLSTSDVQEEISLYIDGVGQKVALQIQSKNLTIVDFVRELNPILTGSYSIRANGVELLAKVVTNLPRDFLNTREIETLTEFMSLRLIDHKTMERPALRCLSHFIDSPNRPDHYSKQLIEFFKDKANIPRMDAKTRHLVYQLLKKIVIQKRSISNVIEGSLIYSVVSILEGENNPENLLLCFSLISFILKNFSNLEPFIDDIFEWLSSYYPIDYTPTEDDDSNVINILRSDLVTSLYDCFYATPLNSENLQTLLLEKLDSSILSSKLESLECLIKCYHHFPLESVRKYNSTFWTAVRMNCLRKINTVDPHLLSTSSKTLEALTRRLAEDSEQYFTFITDMYEELAIAFRKPEMDLYEAAARLMAHAMVPSIVGFNYVLSKVIPMAINSIQAGEMRPLTGLSYIFSQLQLHHRTSDLSQEVVNMSKDFLLKILDKDCHESVGGQRVLETLINLKLPIDDKDVDVIVTKLQMTQQKELDQDIEKCLALICFHYRQYSIIGSGNPENDDLTSLITLMFAMKRAEEASSIQKCLPVYLRLLIMRFDDCDRKELDAMNQTSLMTSLNEMRRFIVEHDTSSQTVEKLAKLHAIILNKLNFENAEKIIMSIFLSPYCQDLVSDKVAQSVKRSTYLPMIRWILKSIVLSNNSHFVPLINLLLNFISSAKVDIELAIEGARIFGFVQSEDNIFNVDHFYVRFSLYQQKFFMQSIKEIKIRVEDKCPDDFRKAVLLTSLAVQTKQIPSQLLKRDLDWLVRHYIKVISSLRNPNQASSNGGETTDTSIGIDSEGQLISELIAGLEATVQKDLNEQLVSLLPSLIELTLSNAQGARCLRVRKQALDCLAKISVSFKESDLLVFRPQVVDRLRACLSDKKRLVREAAAAARLRWVVIGQLVGS